MSFPMRRLGPLGLAAALAVSTVFPASAAPFMPTITNSADVVKVRNGGDHPRMRKAERKHRRAGRIVRQGNHAYFNGHRGYRERRRGYRYHDGYWFPAAAFLGFFIGSAIANSNDYRGSGNYYAAHVEWCHDRYRSYRERDNSWQPYHGPRRQCDSPYS